VAIAVIDDLEIVNINEKHGSRLVWVPFPPVYDALQASQKQGPVRKAGERIVCGAKKQFFLSMFSFGYVSSIVDNSADILVLDQVSNDALEIQPPSVCVS
jgi:hypothetical protein